MGGLVESRTGTGTGEGRGIYTSQVGEQETREVYITTVASGGLWPGPDHASAVLHSW